MFAIFQKHESTNEDDSINDSPQALIIRSVFESGDDFGSEDELNSLRQLEDNLDRIFADNNYDLDGHEVGDGEIVLYAYGDDVDRMLELAKEPLRESPFIWFNITLRYGAVDDENDKETHTRVKLSTT